MRLRPQGSPLATPGPLPLASLLCQCGEADSPFANTSYSLPYSHVFFPHKDC